MNASCGVVRRTWSPAAFLRQPLPVRLKNVLALATFMLENELSAASPNALVCDDEHGPTTESHACGPLPRQRFAFEMKHY